MARRRRRLGQKLVQVVVVMAVFVMERTAAGSGGACGENK